MPAIALKELRITEASGQKLVLKPGDDVPGYDGWKCAIKLALRSQEQVRDLADCSPVLSGEGGRLHLAPFEAPEIEAKALPRQAIEDGIWACGVCKRQFSSAGGLTRHFQRAHKEEG